MQQINLKPPAPDVIPLVLPTPFPVGDVNVYLLKGDVLTLVDAGAKTAEARDVLKRKLAAEGYALSDIQQVVLTHHHVDHIGMLHYLLEENPSLRIYGHWKNEPWLKRDDDFLEYFRRYFKRLYGRIGVHEAGINRVDRVIEGWRKNFPFAHLTKALKEGDGLPGHPEWRVLEVPGHAQTQIGLYRERDGLFIGGDHILQHISSNAMIEAPYEGESERTKPLLQYRDSMRKLVHVDISLVIPGHGIYVKDVSALIGRRLEKQEERADKIKEILTPRPKTCFEICRELFPTVYEKQMVFTISETLGHLDWLEARGEVEQRSEEGRIYHFLTE